MATLLSSTASFINNRPLIKAAAADFSVQWMAFVIAFIFKTEKFYDLVGSSTFLLLTWMTLNWAKEGVSPYFTRQLVQNSCVTLWAARLGMFLFSRVLQSGEDRRFRNAKENPALFFLYWTIQGVWVWMTLLPTMILNLKKRDMDLSYRDYLGFSLWFLGFFIEATADYQKSNFRSIPANKDKFMSTGLWGICRHPNYFGEILMWIGLYLSASSAMEGYEFLSVLSPVFVAYLLTNVSGIPLLEKYAGKKWGNLLKYQQYTKNTAKLVPYIW